jgi:hypothetical protein
MHHTMTAAAPARTVTRRWPAVAVKSDVKTGHDIAYVTRGHASGCAGAMAYYTRTGDPPGTWEGRGCAALGVTGTVEAEVAERLYQDGAGPGGERIIRHAASKSGEDQATAEAFAIARYREEHPFASASEINAERTRPSSGDAPCRAGEREGKRACHQSVVLTSSEQAANSHGIGSSSSFSSTCPSSPT